MTLSCEKPWSSRIYGPGIFVSEVEVASAEDISGQQLPFLERAFDIGIKLRLNIGRDFQPELLIGGNFKRNLETGEVTGWGSAFILQEALVRLGYRGLLTEGNTLPSDVLDSLIGKHFLKLSYVSGLRDGGKLKYTDWNRIAAIDEGGEGLAKRFKKSLAKGYPKNYCSELVDQPQLVTSQKEVLVEDDPF